MLLNNTIQKTFRNEILETKPMWIMRQAGRYLPEYKMVRKTATTFMDFCFNPNLVTTVTLQPIERFDFDAAIIFSDILVIPHTLGQNVDFIEGTGPVLTPLAFEALNLDQMQDRLHPVYEGIRQTRSVLAVDKSLFGFAGTPWTIGCYMLNEGKINNSENFLKKIKAPVTEQIISLLTQCVAQHLIAQIDAGCDVVQLFDSWAALVPSEKRQTYILDPLKKIIEGIRKIYPDVPIIYYGRGASELYPEIESWGVNKLGFGLDESVDIQWAVKNLKSVLQGNFSNEKLITGDFDDILTIKKATQNHPHIFNLGHGIKPETPIAHVEKMIEIWRS